MASRSPGKFWLKHAWVDVGQKCGSCGLSLMISLAFFVSWSLTSRCTRSRGGFKSQLQARQDAANYQQSARGRRFLMELKKAGLASKPSEDI